MRWFRRRSADRPLTVDPARQEALAADVRRRFGGHVPELFQAQAAALAQVLADDDGMVVAGRIVHETAERAHTELTAQAAARGHAVDRRDYRVLYRRTGLRYRLIDDGWHPYVHLPAALIVIEGDVKRAMVLTDPNWLLIHTLELLDLTVAGWAFGQIQATADDAVLVNRLIAAATRMRLTEDEPPALPDGIREVMRSNRVVDVHDQAGRVIGAINPGAETRRMFLQ